MNYLKSFTRKPRARQLLPAIIVAAGILGISPQASQAHLILDNFESYESDKTPKSGWKAREGDPKSVYVIKKEKGNHFLKAKDTGQSVQFFKRERWDIKKYPIFRWKWRAIDFPEGSDELGGINDSVLGVYVVFPKRFFIPESIKYIWSEKLPVGTVIRRNKRFPILVIRSGKAPKNEWVEEERNVYEDYKRFFDRTPGNPEAIGFLTDSNGTKNGAEGDYDDFQAHRKTEIKHSDHKE